MKVCDAICTDCTLGLLLTESAALTGLMAKRTRPAPVGKGNTGDAGAGRDRSFGLTDCSTFPPIAQQWAAFILKGAGPGFFSEAILAPRNTVISGYFSYPGNTLLLAY